MKVKEIIERLQGFNEEAEFITVNGSTPVGFHVSCGSADGGTPETAENVCLCINDVPETANSRLTKTAKRRATGTQPPPTWGQTRARKDNMEKTELDEERDMVNVWHTRATAHQGATENAEKALAAMTAERGQLVSLVEGLHRQLNEMTAAKELTERQVAVLLKDPT